MVFVRALVEVEVDILVEKDADVKVPVGGGVDAVFLLLNETASFTSLVYSHAVLIWLHQLLL